MEAQILMSELAHVTTISVLVVALAISGATEGYHCARGLLILAYKLIPGCAFEVSFTGIAVLFCENTLG